MNLDKKFKIEYLQRNKIIMAVEAIAINSSVLLGIYLATQYLAPGLLQDILIWIGSIFGISYTLYASFGNLQRAFEIKKLLKDSK